jgi:hypothetical protein
MCNIRSLITNYLSRLEESGGCEILEESLTSEYIFLVNTYLCVICFLFCRAWTEQKIFLKLQAMVPNLLDSVVESEGALAVISESVRANILLLTLMIFSDFL